MNKMKKILAILSAAVMTATMAVTSVSAERSEGVVDVDNIIFSINRNKTHNPLYYEYDGFAIDKNYNMNDFDVYRVTSAAVRMVNGAEPVIDENLTVKKLSEYQIRVAQKENACWAYSDGENIDIDITDDVYWISGFENLAAVNEYCQEILDGGDADYAEPIIRTSYGVAQPEGALSFMESKGINDSGFDNYSFVCSIEFDNAEQAESFDINSVEGFEEGLYAKVISDNIIYFQFTKEAEGEIMTNVLIDLQKSEEINNVDVSGYSRLESVGNSSYNISIPEDYAIGDTDCNNAVDLYDVINIAKYMLGNFEMDDARKILADYDDSGEVDIYDAIGIAKTLIE